MEREREAPKKLKDATRTGRSSSGSRCEPLSAKDPGLLVLPFQAPIIHGWGLPRRAQQSLAAWIRCRDGRRRKHSRARGGSRAERCSVKEIEDAGRLASTVEAFGGSSAQVASSVLVGKGRVEALLAKTVAFERGGCYKGLMIEENWLRGVSCWVGRGLDKGDKRGRTDAYTRARSSFLRGDLARLPTWRVDVSSGSSLQF